MLLIVWVAFYIASQFFSFKKYGLEVTPLYVLFKTERFNKVLSQIAEKNNKVWHLFGNLGIVVASLEIPLAIYYLASNLQRFIMMPSQAEPIVPILPGITISFGWFPYILIAVGLTITTHEMAHGILAFVEKIPVKSSGLVLAPITFGGFVEPDEEVFDKSSLRSKLRVLTVGSLTNLITGLLTLLLVVSLFVPASGVLVMAIPENSPAYQAGMRSWDVIYTLNDHPTQSTTDLIQFMSTIAPGTPVIVETSRGRRTITTIASTENKSRAVLVIQDLMNYFSLRVGEFNSQFSYHFYMILNWTYLLTISMAVINMLPLFPFDGEACVYSIIKAKFTKGVKVGRIIINIFSLILLGSNVVLSLIRYGLTPL